MGRNSRNLSRTHCMAVCFSPICYAKVAICVHKNLRILNRIKRTIQAETEVSYICKQILNIKVNRKHKGKQCSCSPLLLG